MIDPAYLWLYHLLAAIEHEATSPVCSSYEYDPTPTAGERLTTIADLAKQRHQSPPQEKP